MKRYITHPNPPRKWNRCAWRWQGYTPYSPIGDGTYQVTDAESQRFIEAADGAALLVDMEGTHERCAEMTRAAVGSLWRNRTVRKQPPVFVNALNPESEFEMGNVLDIFEHAKVVTIGGYISDSPERVNEGVHLGSSFKRDTNYAIRRAKLWREITSLPLAVQILDHYSVPDVSQDGKFIGTAKPLSDDDVVNQATVLAPYFDMVLYWTPEGIDARVIKAWGTR
jgi:hypothetical protein